MLWLKLAVAAIVVWWLALRRSNVTGVIQPAGEADFDPVTAGQVLSGTHNGDVSIGDEWSASFIAGNGNWADAYRSHATTADVDDPNTRFVY